MAATSQVASLPAVHLPRPDPVAWAVARAVQGRLSGRIVPRGRTAGQERREAPRLGLRRGASAADALERCWSFVTGELPALDAGLKAGPPITDQWPGLQAGVRQATISGVTAARRRSGGTAPGARSARPPRAAGRPRRRRRRAGCRTSGA